VVPAILSLCPTASPTGGVSFVIVPTGSSSPVITASNKGQTTTSAPQTFKTASTTTSKPNFVTIPPSAQSSYGGDSAQKSGLKPGAIAGIAIGGLALLVGVLLAIFLIMRRRKRRAGGSARKEANIPRGAELDSRPIEELDGRTIEKTELAATEAVVRVRESPPLSPPVELDGAGMMSSPSELSGNEGTMRSQYGAGGVIPRKQIPQTRAPPVEVISAQGNESPEELERLAEEERRLDAEIAEAERIRDLRNQRASVQERIARAKGGT
jgi:hypothetical protein